ncbi:MAG: hypothetical protein QM530_10970, partial [Phycisphaerales bacterium]|nr:hypothetical protein [Phycisphaerales bacterium]
TSNTPLLTYLRSSIELFGFTKGGSLANQLRRFKQQMKLQIVVNLIFFIALVNRNQKLVEKNAK